VSILYCLWLLRGYFNCVIHTQCHIIVSLFVIGVSVCLYCLMVLMRGVRSVLVLVVTVGICCSYVNMLICRCLRYHSRNLIIMMVQHQCPSVCIGVIIVLSCSSLLMLMCSHMLTLILCHCLCWCRYCIVFVRCC
jgi:hypothetical protein